MKAERNRVAAPLIEIEDVCKYYPIRKGFLKRHVGDVKALDGVSLELFAGETLGLVGESGCGKTTLGRIVAGAHHPTNGHLRYRDADGRETDIAGLKGASLRKYLANVQMVFQDPYGSLNPRRTVMQIIEEPMICLTDLSAAERRAKVFDLLKAVGLDPRHAERYPHAFSGGQRQRIGIARALAVDPKIIVCDESVSALDVSVQGQIINLLTDLQKERGLSFIFISHDLAVVRHIADRIAVMYVGKIVELADTDNIFERPSHPYTEALLSSVLQPDPEAIEGGPILEGEVADPANRPPGCAFHPRCQYAREICRTTEPLLTEVKKDGSTRLAACHFAEELSLQCVVGAPGHAGRSSDTERPTH